MKRERMPMPMNRSTEIQMKDWPASPSVVRAAQTKLYEMLSGNLADAEEELERRATVLKRSHGAAHASAWQRYMAAIDARDYAVKELQRNHFHVSGG